MGGDFGDFECETSAKSPSCHMGSEMVKSRYTGTSGSRDRGRWFREYGSGEEQTGYDRTEKTVSQV